MIRCMLKSTGPIVRINPWELSVKDSEFYTELFVAGNTRRTEKWASSLAGLGFDGKRALSPLRCLEQLYI